MEVTKKIESYIIKDNTELWNIYGTVHKEVKDSTNINIKFKNLKTDSYIGNFTYTVNNLGHINVSFDCNKDINNDIFTYSNQLVNKIIMELN